MFTFLGIVCLVIALFMFVAGWVVPSLESREELRMADAMAPREAFAAVFYAIAGMFAFAAMAFFFGIHGRAGGLKLIFALFGAVLFGSTLIPQIVMTTKVDVLVSARVVAALCIMIGWLLP